MKKSRTLRVKQDFTLSRANYAAWAADVAASVIPFFTRDANQTPLLAVGKVHQQEASPRADPRVPQAARAGDDHELDPPRGPLRGGGPHDPEVVLRDMRAAREGA